MYVFRACTHRLLAGNTQRIAKLIALKADYETLTLITRSDNPAAEAYDWDDKVLQLRSKYVAWNMYQTCTDIDVWTMFSTCTV